MAYLNPAQAATRQNTLTADAAGRALMASGYFNAATVAAKFGANAIEHDRLSARDITVHTTGATLTPTETGSVHTNTGASGAVALVLPAATVGLEFIFIVGAAQELRIDPNTTETISLPSTGVASAAGAYIVADAVGESVHIICGIAGTWQVVGFTGSWTAV